MNIHCKPGHKVIFAYPENGFEHQQKIALKYLVVGDTYRVHDTIIHGWNTEVYLQEFPEVSFNSVFFKDYVQVEEEPADHFLCQVHDEYFKRRENHPARCPWCYIESLKKQLEDQKKSFRYLLDFKLGEHARLAIEEQVMKDFDSQLGAFGLDMNGIKNSCYGDGYNDGLSERDKHA